MKYVILIIWKIWSLLCMERDENNNKKNPSKITSYNFDR